MLVIQNQPDRPLANFGGKLVRRLARHGSSFSEVEPSGKPGAVQSPPRAIEPYRRSITRRETSLSLHPSTEGVSPPLGTHEHDRAPDARSSDQTFVAASFQLA